MKKILMVLTMGIGFAGIASADETLKFSCDADFNAYKDKTFTGSGLISVKSLKENETTSALADVTVNVKSASGVLQQGLELAGSVYTIEAGKFMAEEVYSVELSSKAPEATLKILLKGPDNLSTAKLYLGGEEYYSHCDILKD